AGLVMDGRSFLLVADGMAGKIFRVRVSDGEATQVDVGTGIGIGLAWDHFGRLFASDSKSVIWGIPRPGEKAVLMAKGFDLVANLCVDPTGDYLLVPDMKAGTVTKLPTSIPGWEVDTAPLPLKSAVAFPDLQWEGWDGGKGGKQFPLRPVLLTHA